MGRVLGAENKLWGSVMVDRVRLLFCEEIEVFGLFLEESLVGN